VHVMLKHVPRDIRMISVQKNPVQCSLAVIVALAKPAFPPKSVNK